MSESPTQLPSQSRRYETVVESLLELVAAQGLAPGDVLPTERDLAERFGVSRSVLRQAFGVLEERGLINTRRGAGRYVRESAGLPTTDARSRMEVASIADVLEARVLLEAQIARLACDRRTSQEASTLTQVASRLEGWDDNVAFHSALAACTHNFMLERMVREQMELSSELHQRDHYTDPDQLQRMRNEHLAIATAVAARDAETAGALMDDHLRSTNRLLYHFDAG